MSSEKQQGERQVDAVVGRLTAALQYILALQNKENMHLGRPRTTDKTCITCMAFFAINPGAYGEYISEEDYNKFSKELSA